MNTIWFSSGSSYKFMSTVMKLESKYRDFPKTKGFYLFIAEQAKAVFEIKENGKIVFTEVGI